MLDVDLSSLLVNSQPKLDGLI